MSSIFYIIGVVVVVGVILSYLGLKSPPRLLWRGSVVVVGVILSYLGLR